MPDDKLTISFLVVGDLFKRYTIVVNTLTEETSVYCEECKIWVNQYDGDHLSTQTQDELFEMIVDDHKHQVKGVPVSIADETESFL